MKLRCVRLIVSGIAQSDGRQTWIEGHSHTHVRMEARGQIVNPGDSKTANWRSWPLELFATPIRRTQSGQGSALRGAYWLCTIGKCPEATRRNMPDERKPSKTHSRFASWGTNCEGLASSHQPRKDGDFWRPTSEQQEVQHIQLVKSITSIVWVAKVYQPSTIFGNSTWDSNVGGTDSRVCCIVSIKNHHVGGLRSQGVNWRKSQEEGTKKRRRQEEDEKTRR